jgi:hypothetical protein
MNVMKRMQFSIGSLLLVTASLAIWLWLITSSARDAPWPGRGLLAFSMTLCWYVFARVVHDVFRRVDLSWPAAAICGGIAIVSMLKLLAIWNQDLANLSPWR